MALILITWDTADWGLLEPLIKSGSLPNLARLVSQGATTPLATFSPAHRSPLLTSLATGLPPERHGVLLDSAPASNGIDIEPWPRSARIGTSLFEHADRHGLNVAALAWPAHNLKLLSGRGLVLPPDWHLHPKLSSGLQDASLREAVSELAVSANEIGSADIGAFLGRAPTPEDLQSPEAALLAHSLADSLSQVALATWLVEHAQPDLLAVRFGALGDIGAHFMRYHPPQLSGISDKDFQRWSPVITASYQIHDALIATILQAAPDSEVVVAAPYSWHHGKRRPEMLSLIHI